MNYQLKTVAGLPPNYEEICAVIPSLRGRQNVYFCWGDTIFMASAGMTLTPSLEAHEKMHCIRQQGDPATWWKRWLAEPDFRLAEEIAGHQAEWMTVKLQGISRADRRQHLRAIAERLSGALYGNLVTFDQAKRLIEE